MSSSTMVYDSTFYIFLCPHCNEFLSYPLHTPSPPLPPPSSEDTSDDEGQGLATSQYIPSSQSPRENETFSPTLTPPRNISAPRLAIREEQVSASPSLPPPPPSSPSLPPSPSP